MPPPLDAAAAPGRSIRLKRLRLGILALGVLALLAFVGSSFYDAWRSYRHAVTATDREISNVAHALAEQTAWTWQAVRLLLDDTARYTVKKYTSKKVYRGEDEWQHEQIRLEPLNPDFEAWDVDPEGFAVVAEWLRVIE